MKYFFYSDRNKTYFGDEKAGKKGNSYKQKNAPPLYTKTQYSDIFYLKYCFFKSVEGSQSVSIKNRKLFYLKFFSGFLHSLSPTSQASLTLRFDSVAFQLRCRSEWK